MSQATLAELQRAIEAHIADEADDEDMAPIVNCWFLGVGLSGVGEDNLVHSVTYVTSNSPAYASMGAADLALDIARADVLGDDD
ncbi:hypothetical protein SEA_HEXBUG_2 [Gordonia phage Hexbug]|nr:hypothetical protein SEA_ORLA_2 [Gordonia phage Orla]UVK62916.1 hypothetical protein SEA_HEXBUG_2 [Gordonia phage Hexbug]WNN96093.1 hypothetical protein SEA_NODIGI_2 [Gordonia phage Nodigi]